jgi:two-component system LytT family response regulator
MQRAIIIDDERLARNELKKLLQEFPEVEVVGEAANANEGIEKIESLNPDLVFLDIQMPGKSGFDMLTQIEKAPHVIFVTEYDEYALKAFEVNALDYLMKPVEPKRLADALLKVRQKDEEEMLSYNNRGLLHETEQLFVKVGER